MKQKTLFEKVITTGTLTAVYGIVAGLVLGIMIWGFEILVIYLKMILINGVGSFQNAIESFPVEQITMLGMGFGALIGSVSGVTTVFREDKGRKTKTN